MGGFEATDRQRRIGPVRPTSGILSRMDEEPQVIEVPVQRTVAVRIQHPMAELNLSAAFDRYMPLVGRHVTEAGGEGVGPPYGRYHTYGPTIVDVEIGFPVARIPDGTPALASVAAGEIGASELPAGPVARTVHRGSYDGLKDTYDRLHDWIHAQPGWDDSDGPWESYVDMPSPDGDNAQVRTEVCWPLRRG
jgi:effector-binding domain-containing protein